MNRRQVLDLMRASGVEIRDENGVVSWGGATGGRRKKRGPLLGKRIGLLVAPEFSDFQAYYLTVYLSELGAQVEFVGADGPKWKNTRPTRADSSVHGMWGVSLEPIPVLGSARSCYRRLAEAGGEDYDGVIVLGGHSADILTSEPEALRLLAERQAAGAVIGAIGEGTLPLVTANLISGQNCTGNSIVSYLLKRVGSFQEAAVVRDGMLVTARNTIDTPAFLREFVRAFDPTFVDAREKLLSGRKILCIAGEDFEDIEVVVPVLELCYRGAELTIATFPAPMRSRPPLIGLDVVMGNFGVSIPFQEIPASNYRLAPLASIDPGSVDMVMIPGAFCPWNIVASGEPIQWLRAAAPKVIVAAICHGPIPLAAAELVQGKCITGVEACRPHITVMGGNFSPNLSAVVDGSIVTGRVPTDVPEFLDAMSFALLERST